MIIVKENYMKIKVRRGMWESNSSSSHSLCMMMKSDYDKWQIREKEENTFIDVNGRIWIRI